LRKHEVGGEISIVNPDIYFEGDVVTPMVQYMADDMTIGMMMPQILNEDGSVQTYLSCCRVRFYIEKENKNTIEGVSEIYQ
jgi:GT2 family glycosyltransferase